MYVCKFNKYQPWLLM